MYEVDPQFLFIALGIGKMKRDWVAINFTAQRIVNMLGPAMLRLGGTRGDFLTFDESVVQSEYIYLAVTHESRDCFSNGIILLSLFYAITRFL